MSVVALSSDDDSQLGSNVCIATLYQQEAHNGTSVRLTQELQSNLGNKETETQEKSYGFQRGQ